MSSSNTPLIFLGAAIVGVVSAIGLFITEHWMQERRRHSVAADMARMNQQLSGMREELQQLRLLQKEKNAQRLRKNNRQSATRSVSSLSTASSNYKSSLDIDSSDLEFYDFSDEDDNDSSTSITPLDQTLKTIDKSNWSNIAEINKNIITLNNLRLRYPENIEVMWRIGKAHYKVTNATTDKITIRESIENGLSACERALQLNWDSGEAHKWYALLVGVRCDSQPIKEKISDGLLFKKHLDYAVAAIPGDPILHYLLGRFAFEAANLKWYERQVAATFFAAPPKGTFEEGLSFAQEAERLTKTDWKENKLLIAKCQIGLGQYKEAVQSLMSADKMDNEESMENEVDDQVKALLHKYIGYR